MPELGGRYEFIYRYNGSRSRQPLVPCIALLASSAILPTLQRAWKPERVLPWAQHDWAFKYGNGGVSASRRNALA